MQVHYQLEQLPAFKNAIVTIGTFDGVHTGHQQILHQLVAHARENNGEAVLVTFHPHPRLIVGNFNNQPIKLINTLDERLERIAKTGIDHVVVVPFTAEFANQTAEAYIRNFLVERFQPHTIVIGYDHRFGKGRTGNFQLLESYKEQFGYCLKEIPAEILHNNNISSTLIRKLTAEGNIAEANYLLGYAFYFEGTVIKGNQLGRTIGYPTANISIQDGDKLVPGNGVYVVTIEMAHCLVPGKKAFPGSIYKGMMNIGVRPTVDGTNRTIEVNIFDFNEDIYDAPIRITVHQLLRHEQKFNGLDALKHQLALDKVAALQVFQEA